MLNLTFIFYETYFFGNFVVFCCIPNFTYILHDWLVQGFGNFVLDHNFINILKIYIIVTLFESAKLDLQVCISNIFQRTDISEDIAIYLSYTSHICKLKYFIALIESGLRQRKSN